MELTTVDKIKISKYLRSHAVDEIYYIDLCDEIGKRGKIKDIEFLEYFTDCVAKEFRKDEKISIKQLTKLICIIDNFLHWIKNDGNEIDESTLDIIRSFEDLYDEYLNRTNFDIDLEFTDDVIGQVLSTVNELYPSKSENSESLGKYINKIAELEATVKKLRKELDEANRLYGLLEESHNKDAEKVDTLSQSVIELGKDGRSKAKEIASLNETIQGLNSRIAELEGILESKNGELEYYIPFKEQCEALSLEVERLKKVIEDDIREQTAKAAKKATESQIEALIYQQLMFDGANIEQILRSLKAKGFVSDKDEVYSLLKRMKSMINIESNSFSLTPSYKIVSPKVSEDGEFKIDIPAGCKHYDVMLVGDFHIKDLEHKVLNGFDILNNYCAGNSINLIVNIGDFYHANPGHTFEYSDAVNNYRVVEKSISMIPKAPGIYHAVLGGNHDMSMVKYGFDPIRMLCDEREDFINLGYTHSTIALNGFYNPLGRFDIHHPSSFDFPIYLDDDGIDLVDMNGYLEDLYKKQGRCRDDSYIDIFGHTHRSQFNYPAGYCYIPSFFEGRSKRGACHLRIYFDEDTDIKYMVFMPLTFSDRLLKNTEIVYQKILTK